MFFLWQIKLGIVGIVKTINFPSCDLISKNTYKLRSTELNYDGGCSIMVITPGCGKQCPREAFASLITRASLQIPGNEGSIPSFRPFKKEELK